MVFIPLGTHFGNQSGAKVKLFTQFLTKTFGSYTIPAMEGKKKTLNKQTKQKWVTCRMAKKCLLVVNGRNLCLHEDLANLTLTRAMSFSPSRSLQFLFFNLWASSMITQLQWIFFSSGQSARIISNVVMTTWNLKTPERGFPWGWHNRTQSFRPQLLSLEGLLAGSEEAAP